MPSPAPTIGPAWYAVYTRHQHEKVIANILFGAGFEVFLPLYEAAHHWKDRIKRLTLPLFPTYVFLRTSLDRRIEVLRIPGVNQFVGFGRLPSAIPDEEIGALRKVIENSCPVEPHPFLQCGERVRVTSGPLEGVVGLLVRKKNQCRLVLSIEILNRSVAVEVETDEVERPPAVQRAAFPRGIVFWNGLSARNPG